MSKSQIRKHNAELRHAEDQDWDDPSDYKKGDNRKVNHNHNLERREKEKKKWIV